MQFRLIHLFFVVSLFAVLFGMRYWWVAWEEDVIAGLTPIVVACLCGMWLGAWNCPTWKTTAVSGMVGIAASAWLAVERVLYLPPPQLLPSQFIYYPYLAAREIIATTAIASTGMAMITGGVAGFVTRRLRQRGVRGNLEDLRRRLRDLRWNSFC